MPFPYPLRRKPAWRDPRGWDFQDLRAKSMITNNRPKAAYWEMRIPRCVPRLIYPASHKFENSSADGSHYTEKDVMELRVQLKVCEGCGCLWFRSQCQMTVYCQGCNEKLKDFPSPESRKRRGRPSRKAPSRPFASFGNYSATGGAQ